MTEVDVGVLELGDRLPLAYSKYRPGMKKRAVKRIASDHDLFYETLAGYIKDVEKTRNVYGRNPNSNLNEISQEDYDSLLQASDAPREEVVTCKPGHAGVGRSVLRGVGVTIDIMAGLSLLTFLGFITYGVVMTIYALTVMGFDLIGIHLPCLVLLIDRCVNG